MLPKEGAVAVGGLTVFPLGDVVVGELAPLLQRVSALRYDNAVCSSRVLLQSLGPLLRSLHLDHCQSVVATDVENIVDACSGLKSLR